MKFDPLPCPCCGSKAEFFENKLFSDHRAIYIECTDCGVGTQEISFEAENSEARVMAMEDLRRAWNKRVQLAPIVTYEARRIQQRQLH